MNKKTLIAFLTVIFVVLHIGTFVFAEPTQTPQEQQQTTQEVDLSVPAPHAGAVILSDLKSGKVLYERNATDKMYPASTTKILTAILVLENANLGDVVIVPADAINPINNNHSHMGILIGEELTVEQLLYGMLVYSANDAANVLAIHVAGSLEAFAQMMNNKANELGASNSHFVNPHGFHDDNHYTTAQDLTTIARYAMQIEKFREIVKTDMYTIDPTNKYKEIRYLSNTNHLVSRRRQANYFYKKATGIKTGFTDEAASCLVSSAVDGDTELLSVVMKCHNTTIEENGAYSFVESKELLEYGFKNFKYITIAKNGEIVSDSGVYEARNNVRVALTPKDDISALLPSDIKLDEVLKKCELNEKIKAPIKIGDILGTVTYEYQGEIVGSSSLVATNDVERDYILMIIHLILKIIFNPIFLILVIAIVVLRIRAKIIRERNRKKRRSRLNYVNSQLGEREHHNEFKRRRFDK